MLIFVVLLKDFPNLIHPNDVVKRLRDFVEENRQDVK